MINLEVNYKTGLKYPKSFWTKYLKRTLKQIKSKRSLDISLAVVKKSEIRKYNKIYRGQNKVTDVLSFSDAESDLDFPQEKISTGEILICYQQAVGQAKKNHWPVKTELALLFVHGLLHLLGYDHIRLKDYRVMHQLEQKILSLKP